MLTIYENRFNCFLMRWVCFTNFLPIEVKREEKVQAEELLDNNNEDLYDEREILELNKLRRRSRASSSVIIMGGENGLDPEAGKRQGDIQISIESVPWKMRMWRGYFCLYLCHGIYVNARLLQSLVDSSAFRIKHFPIHFLWALFSVSLQNFAYISFIKWPNYSVEIYNKIYSQLGADRTKTRKLTQMNKQELLAMSFGVLIYMTDIVLVGVLSLDDTRLQLFYTALPSDLQSPSAFYICLLLEAICVTYFCTIGYFVLLVHLMFFEMANGYLKEAENTTKKKGDHFSLGGAIKACKEIRRLQLLIQLFNQSNCFLIFSFKLHCIATALVGSFFAIRHGYEEPMLGLLCIVVTLDALIFFGFIYEKAFMIPEQMERLKEQVALGAGRKGVGDKRRGKQISKIMESIPLVGIKVGGFNTMERISSLTFFHFVICQLVSLLVAFK